MSNQDEEEVEDELAALEAEVARRESGQRIQLPNVPDTQLPSQKVRDETRPELAEQGAQPARKAMLAS
jgi:charged multivesicular body protein 6